MIVRTGTCSWVSPECMLDSPYCSSDAQCPGSHSCRQYAGLLHLRAVGDPTLILSVPEQFRDSYVFLTPTNFVEDYINVVAPAGATVTLDGNPVADAVLPSGSNYKVARLPVTDGVHTLFATEPVGVVAYGYDEDVSYGYPAGLSLSSALDVHSTGIGSNSMKSRPAGREPGLSGTPGGVRTVPTPPFKRNFHQIASFHVMFRQMPGEPSIPHAAHQGFGFGVKIRELEELRTPHEQSVGRTRGFFEESATTNSTCSARSSRLRAFA